VPHRFEGRSLIGLLERVRPCDPSHQNHREDYNVFFAEGEEILRPGQCAFQQTPVEQKMRLAGCLGFEAIVFNDNLYRQPIGLIRQGQPES